MKDNILKIHVFTDFLLPGKTRSAMNRQHCILTVLFRHPKLNHDFICICPSYKTNIKYKKHKHTTIHKSLVILKPPIVKKHCFMQKVWAWQYINLIWGIEKIVLLIWLKSRWKQNKTKNTKGSNYKIKLKSGFICFAYCSIDHVMLYILSVKP